MNPVLKKRSVATYSYDEKGNLILETHYQNTNAGESSIEITYAYALMQDSISTSEYVPTSMHYYEEMYFDQTYTLDYTLYFEIDSDGRITTVSNYNSNGDLVAVVDQEYDADGNYTKKYELATSKDGLYLECYYQEWEDGRLSRTERSDGMYSQKYIYDKNGKLSVMYFYENERLYMEDVYAYDPLGRIANIARTNYGNWPFNIEYSYEGDHENPYYKKMGR